MPESFFHLVRLLVGLVLLLPADAVSGSSEKALHSPSVADSPLPLFAILQRFLGDSSRYSTLFFSFLITIFDYHFIGHHLLIGPGFLRDSLGILQTTRRFLQCLIINLGHHPVIGPGFLRILWGFFNHSTRFFSFRYVRLPFWVTVHWLDQDSWGFSMILEDCWGISWGILQAIQCLFAMFDYHFEATIHWLNQDFWGFLGIFGPFCHVPSGFFGILSFTWRSLKMIYRCLSFFDCLFTLSSAFFWWFFKFFFIFIFIIYHYYYDYDYYY